jgi:putative Mg2+ transporter-C (MgtC) family protein
VYRSDNNVEITAELISLAVNPADLDAVVAGLAKLPGVNHATWNVSTLD